MEFLEANFETNGEPDPASAEAASEPSAEPATLECWRCGLLASDEDFVCPHCAAPLDQTKLNVGDSRISLASRVAPADERAIKTLFWTYALLLATGLIHATIVDIRFEDVEEVTTHVLQELLHQVALFEAIDTIVVVAALLIAGGFLRSPTVAGKSQLLAWLAALPLLAGCLALNFAYHSFLNHSLGLEDVERSLLDEHSLLAFALTCLQPAIVEELYSRGFAIGVLGTIASPHAAVWISAVMFGLMHVSVLLSIPYLILLGVLLGYLRYASGSLLLPILVHFLHNLAVMLWN